MNTKKGFTLIELLIVIALLGALAIGLIGAIDPFEQLKKGTDTGTRDLVNQVQTAIIRYYAVKTDMPWIANPTITNLQTAPMVAAITNMANAGELRNDFTTIQAGRLDEVFVTGSTVNTTAIVCYLPTSKSFQADPNTKYTQAGVVQPVGTCKSGGGSTNCYWCIQ